MIDATKQPGIRLAQIFLERAAFEHRADFLDFPPTTQVAADVELGLHAGLSADGSKARVQIEVRSQEAGAPPFYKFSILMTALVETEEGSANFPLTEYVRTHAWGLMYPFVRETVASITGRGRFGPLWLKPVNLVALAGQVVESPAKEIA